METKDFIGLGLVLLAIAGGGLTATFWRGGREAAFFLMVVGAVVSHRLDINFLSHYWYRGTTRGLEFSFVDVLALSVLLGTLLRPRPGQARWFWPAGMGMMLVFAGYACVVVAISEPRIYGVFELSKIFRSLLVFVAAALFVRTERALGILILALACALSLEGALAVKQRYWDGFHRVSGTLEHPNSLSMYLCLVSPVVFAASLSTLPRRWRLFSAAAVAAGCIGILLTISRAGIPIFACVMFGTALWCVSWRVTLRKLAIGATCLAAVGVMLYQSWDTLAARYAEATFEAEYFDDRIEGRGYYLRLARSIVEDRFLGVGLNNWSYWVSKRYGPRLGTPYRDYEDLAHVTDKGAVESLEYAAPAHNLLALTVGELGVPGLLIFLGLWLRWFQIGAAFIWKRPSGTLDRLGVGIFFGTTGVFLQSVTEWTFRQTQILFTFHILLGVLASLYWIKRRGRRRLNRFPRPRPQEVHHETVVA